jgi:hypothetical protein
MMSTGVRWGRWVLQMALHDACLLFLLPPGHSGNLPWNIAVCSAPKPTKPDKAPALFVHTGDASSPTHSVYVTNFIGGQTNSPKLRNTAYRRVRMQFGDPERPVRVRCFQALGILFDDLRVWLIHPFSLPIVRSRFVTKSLTLSERRMSEACWISLRRFCVNRCCTVMHRTANRRIGRPGNSLLNKT